MHAAAGAAHETGVEGRQILPQARYIVALRVYRDVNHLNVGAAGAQVPARLRQHCQRHRADIGTGGIAE